MLNKNNEVAVRYNIEAETARYSATIYKTLGGSFFGEYAPIPPDDSQPPIRVFDFSRPMQDQRKESVEILALCIANIGAKSGEIISVSKI